MSSAARARGPGGPAPAARPKRGPAGEGEREKDRPAPAAAPAAPPPRRRSVEEPRRPAKAKAATGPPATARPPELHVGTAVEVVGLGSGTVMYCGPTATGKGEWVGVALDAPNGKKDGTLNGHTYFKCRPGHGAFVRRAQVSLDPPDPSTEAPVAEGIAEPQPRGGYMPHDPAAPPRRGCSDPAAPPPPPPLSPAHSLGKPATPPLAAGSPLILGLPAQPLAPRVDLPLFRTGSMGRRRGTPPSGGSSAPSSILALTEEAASVGPGSVPAASPPAGLSPVAPLSPRLVCSPGHSPEQPAAVRDAESSPLALRDPFSPSPVPHFPPSPVPACKPLVPHPDAPEPHADPVKDGTLRTSPVKGPPGGAVSPSDAAKLRGPPMDASPPETERWWNEEWQRTCAEAGAAACQALGQGCTAQARRDAADQLWAAHREGLARFEAGCSYSQQVAPDPEQLMRALGQAVPATELTDPAAKPNLVPLDKLLQRLREMKTRPSAEVWCDALDEGIDLLKKAEGLVRSSRLNSQDWMDIVNPVVNLLSDHVDTPEVSQNLLKSNEEVKRAMFTVEEIAHAQQEALMEGDVIRAEDLYHGKLDSQEAVTRLLMSQIDILEELRAALVEAQLRRINQAHNRANVGFSDHLRVLQKRKDRLQQETEALAEEAAHIRQRMQQAEEDFDQLLLKSDAVLRDQGAREQALWDQIAAAEAELLRLAAERTEAVAGRLVLVADRRRAEVEERQRAAFIRERGDALGLTLRRLEAAEELTDTLAEFVGGGCRAMEHRAQTVDQQIEELKLEVHRKHFQEFRKLYLTLGELTYRKEQNALEVDKKIEMARVQQELLMDSLNPAAKEAADRRKQLIRVKEEMAEKVNGLRERAAAFEQRFRLTEQALITAGEQFLHPRDELQQTNENRKLKILEYHKLGASEIAEGEELVAAMELTLKNPAIPRLLATPSTSHARRFEPFRVRPLADTDD